LNRSVRFDGRDDKHPPWLTRTSMERAQPYPAKRTMALPAILLLACLLGVPSGCRRRHVSRPVAQPTRSVSRSEEAARRLVRRFDQALRTRGPIRIVVTEDEATSYLDLNLKDAPVHDLSVWFTPDGIHLSAKVRAWREARLQALLTVTCPDGVPQVQVHGAFLDGHPLPRILLASLEEATNDALADAHYPLKVERVVLGEGFMVVTGSTDQGG